MRRIAFEGWRNAVELRNESVRVVVVPQVGRILYFGPFEGPNLIWIHPELRGRLLREVSPQIEGPDMVWANFGGDKVWPVEQFRWTEVNGRAWPPDPWFDGHPHDIDIRDGEVTLTGPISVLCGARIIRTIRLEASGAVIRQRLEKVRSGRREDLEPIPLTIWSVTQVVQPDEILFPLHPRSRFPGQIFIYDENPVTSANTSREDGTGILIPSDTDHQKIGTDGDGWMAAVCGDHAFAQKFHKEPDGVYPENGLSVEVYTSPECYTELEVLSPLKRLEPGQSMESEIFWEWIPLAAGTAAHKRRQIREALR